MAGTIGKTKGDDLYNVADFSVSVSYKYFANGIFWSHSEQNLVLPSPAFFLI